MRLPSVRRHLAGACVALLSTACSAKGGVARSSVAAPPSLPTGDAHEDAREKESLRKLEALYQKGADAQKRDAQEDAIRAFRDALEIKGLPKSVQAIRGSLHYDIACSQARLGRASDALSSLEEAAKEGYADAEHVKGDRDLAPLRGHREFEQVLSTFRENGRRLRVYDVVRSDSPDLGWAHLHTFEDIESPSFAELRTRYQLASVTRGAKTELEKQLALLAWVHNRWPHAGLLEPAHEDALTILREVDEGKRFRCVEYSVVSTQVLQAMGYPARVVSLRTDGSSFGVGKGHVVTEVWNNDLQKWIVLDGQNNGTWQAGGTLLSAAESRHARRSNIEDLRFVLGPSKWRPDKPEAEQRAEWGRYFEHLSFRVDNVQPSGSAKVGDKVALLYPGERYELLFQGAPEQNRTQTSLVEKIYPVLGRVHVNLEARVPGKAEVRVDLTHSMPWFSHYRVQRDGRYEDTKSTTLVWQLKPGRNEIVVSAVNVMSVEGKPTTLAVDFIPPG